jgi:hypothetical protein
VVAQARGVEEVAVAVGGGADGGVAEVVLVAIVVDAVVEAHLDGESLDHRGVEALCDCGDGGEQAGELVLA